MCGIAGFVGRGDREDLARMSDALRHRGPDGYGEWVDSAHAVHLAVHRLAILDRDNGAQPMCAPDRPVVVAYNGEIYNHVELRSELEQLGCRFRTDHLDTEVLLNAYRIWGPGLTARLNGMWAFAIFDASRHTLFLSRDRFGQKPLFYTQQNGTFAFASELTGVLQHASIERSVSNLSVQKYFAYGFIPAPGSLYKRVFKVPAGCSLTVDTRTLEHRVTRYWDYSLEDQEEIPHSANAERELAERLRVLLREAVRRQLRSDVPAGVFLSGGIDSATISYFAAQDTPRLDTFSIGFDRSGFDESDQALRVSSLLGTRHRATNLTALDAPRVLSRIAARLDEPIGDSSLICTELLCETARQNVIVALGGEGADELFGGYDPFRALSLARMYSRFMPQPIHRAIRLLAARVPSRGGYMPLDYRLTHALRGLSYPPALWNPAWIGPLEPRDLQACFDSPINLEGIYSEAIELWDGCRHSGLVEKTLQFYVKLYFQDDILAKVDRASMMNSLEVRSPFLDLDLVDFVRRLPTRFTLRHGRTKFLFKEAMRSLLPSWIVDRPKHGFAVPMAEWLRESWLILGTPAVPPGMRTEFVSRRVSAHRAATENNAVFLWSLWLLTQITDSHART
jgi:asparagine synthase (glutamine-hydrolysing)